MGEEKHILENDFESCEYAECTYSEWDTGYKEYECTLTHFDCCGVCPLDCKYTIHEDVLNET